MKCIMILSYIIHAYIFKFVQFVDIHVNDFRTKIRPNPTLKSMAEELTALLRDDVMYVAVRLELFCGKYLRVHKI